MSVKPLSVEILQTADRATLGEIDDVEFARFVSALGDDELLAAMEPNREAILDEIIERIPPRLRPGAATDLAVVIDWVVLDCPAHGVDRFQLVVESGACAASRDGSRTAGATLRMRLTDVARIVAGDRDPVELFTLGRLSVDGDLTLAARVPSLFDFPPARREPTAG